MVSKLDFNAIEARLANPQLGADELHDIVAQAGLTDRFRPGRVFPIGIVVPDAVRARVEVTPADVSVLVDQLVNSCGAVRSWRVFPLGIVRPDRYAVEVDVGRPFAVGGGG
jgi:hypothetical protein